MNPSDAVRMPWFDLGSAIKRANEQFYPNAAAQENSVTGSGNSRNEDRPMACVAAPDQHAHNRAFEGLVEQMGEFMEVWSYEDLLAAVHKADEIEQERQAAIDDFMAKGR